MSQHWASIREAGALSGMRIMVWIHSHLGRHVFGIALVPVMAYYFLRRGEARRASLQYLRRIRRSYPGSLPGLPLLAISFRHFLAFGQSLLDKYIAWTVETPTILMEAGEEALLFDLVKRRVGCLAIGSHFGNLEYSRGISRRHPEIVINVLLHDRHAVKFSALMQQAEPDSRMHLIQVSELDPAMVLVLKEKVARGEWVVIAGDRVPIGSKNRTCTARFIDDPAQFPVGPYVFASVLQCPVYLLHCFRLGGEYQLGIEFFADCVTLPRNERQATLERLAGRFAAALEAQVVRAPLQWFNFYDFWDVRPERPFPATERRAE